VTRLSVFIASSLDGYIATEDNWLDAAKLAGEDYGYEDFISTVDAVAMGRGTYDFIAAIEPLPYGERPMFVFTHRPPVPREGVTFWSPTPAEAAATWQELGLVRVYVDGGQLISSFLAAGLIDDMVLTRVPVLLGTGRPLFPAIDASSSWRLEDEQTWPSGLVNSRHSRA
jgi:dihydrofolate reductase